MIIPQVWQDILTEIQAIYPSAIIAGGAIRDTDNGRPVKDLDVMIQVPADTSFDDVILNLHKLPNLKVVRFGRGEYVNGWQDEVLGYVDLRHPNIDVQVMPVTTPVEDSLERLDFGICQIGYDGRHIFSTPAYERDKRNQTFTIVRADTEDQRARSLRRFDRIGKKYEGWKLVA